MEGGGGGGGLNSAFSVIVIIGSFLWKICCFISFQSNFNAMQTLVFRLGDLWFTPLRRSHKNSLY